MKSKVFFDHFDFKMFINAIRNAINNAIRINWVNFFLNATLYALKTLILWKRQRYAGEKLNFTKIQRYKIQKR